MCLIEQEGVEERAVFHRVRFLYFEFVPTVQRSVSSQKPFGRPKNVAEVGGKADTGSMADEDLLRVLLCSRCLGLNWYQDACHTAQSSGLGRSGKEESGSSACKGC